MRGSTDFLKQVRFGHSFSLASPAVCMSLYDEWAGLMKPNDFNPLIALLGGMSIVGEANRGLDALIIGNDWVNQCRKAGASTKNAILCLALNYDVYPGMVACALELGMIAAKKGTEKSIRLTRKAFLDVVLQIYGHDCAGIYTLMREKWVEFKPGIKLPRAIKTRSAWRKELGYDVLLHPVTLKPCCDSNGVPLRYFGTWHNLSTPEARTNFKFEQVGNDTPFETKQFPPPPTEH